MYFNPLHCISLISSVHANMFFPYLPRISASKDFSEIEIVDSHVYSMQNIGALEILPDLHCST